MPKQKRIVVTGIGPIASSGIGKDNLWQGICNKTTGLELVESYVHNELWERFYLHKVRGFSIDAFGIDKNDLAYISQWKEGQDNRDLFFLLAALKLAFDDSKINYREKAAGRIALVATHENPCLEQLFWQMFRKAYKTLRDNPGIGEKSFYERLYPALVKVGYETQSFMPLFHIARTFNIHNYSLFINNACASGLYALEAAADIIRCAKADIVAVVAGDCPDVFKHLWFKMINMYAQDGRIKPFAKDSNGFVLGEGAAAIVLEDYECARRRDSHIYAEYLGGGFTLEGWGITTPMIGGRYYQEAMLQALRQAGIEAKDVDLICAHGAATPSSDYYEARAIADVFGEYAVEVSALKPYLGHNLGGSSLLELAVMLLVLEHQMALPVMNTTEQDTRFKLKLIPKEQKKRIMTILKLCCAFAGNNAAAIFRKIT